MSSKNIVVWSLLGETLGQLGLCSINNFLSFNFPVKMNMNARLKKVIPGPNLKVLASIMSFINIVVWSLLWEKLGKLGLYVPSRVSFLSTSYKHKPKHEITKGRAWFQFKALGLLNVFD